jgi:hypothetical protein
MVSIAAEGEGGNKDASGDGKVGTSGLDEREKEE